MIKKIRKTVAWVFAVSMILCSGSNAKAIEDNLIKVDEYNVNECVIIAALDWGEMMYPELKLEVGDIHKVNVAYSEEVEYAVSYFVGVVPYGYAVVCFKNGEAVVKEATVGKGREGLYTDLIDVVDENSEIASQNLNIEGNVIEMMPMKYCVVTTNSENETVSYDNYGNKYLEELTGYADTYEKENSIFIKKDNWNSTNYQVSESIVIDQFSGKWVFGEGMAKTSTGRYACMVQAFYNIAHWEGIVGRLSSTMSTEYVKIWNMTQTYQIAASNPTDTVIYGATNLYNGVDGFINYVHEKGYTGTEKKEICQSPSVSWLKDKLEYNRPILMVYTIELNSGAQSNHAIAVMGYKRAKKVSSNNVWNYLMVADGWSATETYLNYSTVDFKDCKATYFWIKK